MACNGMASSFFPSTGFLLQMQTPHDHHEDDPRHHLPPSLAPGLSHDYNGVTALLGKRNSMAAYEQHQAPPCEEMNGEDELSDDCGSQLGEKKRRLNMEQVRTLEKNFELGNKLEPERKMQLARALGLQPRQIAIWFQNRRARWKTKQLEKDYDLLKKQFEAVKSENDALQSQNKKLQAEILALNGREMSSEPINLNKETEVSCSYRSDNSSDINLEITRTPPSNESPSNNNNSHQQSMSFFPIRPPVGSTKQQPPQLLQCPKVEHGGGQEESFCNMFCSLDDQVPTGFWTPWQEQQSFH